MDTAINTTVVAAFAFSAAALIATFLWDVGFGVIRSRSSRREKRGRGN